MSNISTGHKTITVRRQTPAPSGHGLQASLKRLSSELTQPEPYDAPACIPEAVTLPGPQPAAEPLPYPEVMSVQEPQSGHMAQDASELHRYTGPFYYYVRCRSGGPVWTPEPSHAQMHGIALYTSVYIDAAAVPSFLYVRCGADSPIWIPINPMT